MLVSVLTVLLTAVGVLKAESIDEIIMKAAPSASAMDTFHMSPEGGVLVTLGLDMRVDVEQYTALMDDSEVSRQKRKALRNRAYRWPECKVYYEISNVAFTSKEQSVIIAAIKEWEKYTCLDFREARSGDRIVFRRGSGGCYSRLGKVGGAQEIGLSRGCVHKGVVVHEIGHAIGWIHEQARPDRDNFIRVNFNRIPASWHSQFEKFSSRYIDDHEVPYDYLSIMHYSGNAVAPMAITTLDPDFQSVIGQRGGLSFRDVMLANIMYNCADMVCSANSDTNCRARYGQDSFLFKREEDSTCACFCPGDSEEEIVRPCNPSDLTTARPSITSPTAVTSTTTTPEPDPMECLDLRDDCAELKESGECKMDMERMFVFCKKTCKFCEKENMCMDYDPSCSLLALADFCNRPDFSDLMKKKCPKSCKLCVPVEPCRMQQEMGLDSSSPGTSQPSSGVILPCLGLSALAFHLVLH